MSGEHLSPLRLARQYWPRLAPTWLAPLFVMSAVVTNDLSGPPFLAMALFFMAFAFLIGGTISAALLQQRDHLRYGCLYIIWLVPGMVFWCALVFIRAAILISLGRPL
jgi:hypothetical protein